MEIKHKPYGPYERFFKRPIDIVCALLAIAVFSWLYIILAILVRVKLGSPVIFKQPRPGKDEKIFNLYKFRSMTDERDEKGEPLPDEVRLTKFGKLLRATSLDELPEAFNILKGDMSVVGPRPLMARYLDYYTEEEKRRHEVRPGLSGYAQVQGRNNVNWEERLRLDVYYVDNVTLRMDIKVVIDTILIVFKREGISTEDMTNFDDFRKKQWEEQDWAESGNGQL